MRISIIGPYPPFRGGISDFNTALNLELAKSNQRQIINFTTQYPKLLFPGKTQFKENTNIVAQSERILSSINPITWKKTINKIVDFNPDLIVIHYWMPFFAPAYIKIISSLKKRINAQVIAICHNLIPHEKHRFNNYLLKRFVSKVDKFIIMSKSVEAELLKVKPNAKYIYSPHPIYNIFGKSIDKNVARKKLIINAKKVILYFGLIREYKGLDILLKSIPRLVDELKDFIVVIAGECYENPEKYHDIIEELKIQKYVDLKLMFIPDDEVKFLFSAADVVVLPYLRATQSGITQIAYHFNLPVIVSDVGGLPDFVPNGKVGYVVPPTVNDFAEAIITYFKNDNFDEFSNNIKTYKLQFSWSKFVDNLLGLASE